jgi:serine/threonine-protein kinase
MSQDPDRTGTVIDGKYELERLIGRGGMGTVYAARQVQLDRKVAVKILRPDVTSDDRAIARFNREARAAARIEHPNAVRVYDFGSNDEVGAYIVMEYVEGVPLRTLMRRTRIVPLDVVLEVVWQAASAIAVAHGSGIVHRDLKPENFIVSQAENGSISLKVVDFGLAKLVEGDAAQITSPAEMIGTPRYMAPEQFNGEDVDERVDVYSMGVILFEMLTGRAPFDGTFSEVVGKHLYAEPPTFASLEMNIPEDVEAVVRRALAKKPADRQKSIYELARDFVRCFGIEVPAGTALIVPAALTSRTGLIFEGLDALDEPAPVLDPEAYATRVAERDDARTVVRPSPAIAAVAAPSEPAVALVDAAAPPATEGFPAPTHPSRLAWLWIGLAGAVAIVVLVVGVAALTGAVVLWRGSAPAPAAPPSAGSQPAAQAPAAPTQPTQATAGAPSEDDDEPVSEALQGVPFYVGGRLVVYGDPQDFPAGTVVVIRDNVSGVRERLALEPNEKKTKWVVPRDATSVPSGRTVEQLVPPDTWVEIVVRRPDGSETAPRMISRADE